MKEIGFPDYCITKDGDVYSLKVNRFLRPAKNGYNSGNYYFVHIYNAERKLINVTIHRLVAKMFIPNDNPKEKTHVNHIDGDKLNNSVSNLEWITPRQNNLHANETGLRKPTYLTDKNILPKEDEILHDWNIVGNRDLSDDDVHKVCQMLEDGYRVCDVSRMTAFDRRLIQHIRDNDKPCWSHIVESYDMSKIKRKTKTSVEKLMLICEQLQEGIGIMEVARNLECDRKLVGNIKARKFHKQISDNYVW